MLLEATHFVQLTNVESQLDAGNYSPSQLLAKQRAAEGDPESKILWESFI